MPPLLDLASMTVTGLMLEVLHTSFVRAVAQRRRWRAVVCTWLGVCLGTLAYAHVIKSLGVWGAVALATGAAIGAALALRPLGP